MKHVSLIGYSLGGLIGRYLAGLLETKDFYGAAQHRRGAARSAPAARYGATAGPIHSFISLPALSPTAGLIPVNFITLACPHLVRRFTSCPTHPRLCHRATRQAGGSLVVSLSDRRTKPAHAAHPFLPSLEPSRASFLCIRGLCRAASPGSKSGCSRCSVARQVGRRFCCACQLLFDLSTSQQSEEE